MPNFDLQSIEQSSTVGAISYEPSMPSTSDGAKEQLLKDPSTELPLLVLCDQQTSGRGQPGKSWQSNLQSLTFTYCLSVAPIPNSNHSLLPLIVGVSVCDAIHNIGIKGAKLKWPNDVLIDRKKVCGILVEKVSSAEHSWFLIGIGINVNQNDAEIQALGQSQAKFPPTSLRTILDKTIDMQNLLSAIIQQVNDNVAAESDWPNQIESRFDFLSDAIEFAKPNGEIVSGIFRGVDSKGRLRIDRDGKTGLFTSGQILAAH